MSEVQSGDYEGFLTGIVSVLEEARRRAAKAINALLTATYWDIGRRIVVFDQAGSARAQYGSALLERLSSDRTTRFGRGFSPDNLENMRLFFQTYLPERISEMMSRNSGTREISETSSRIFNLEELASCFGLSWSHYVLLIRRSRSEHARNPWFKVVEPACLRDIKVCSSQANGAANSRIACVGSKTCFRLAT